MENIQAMESGDIDILVFNGKEWMRNYLSNIFHVPELSFNLFSDVASDKGLQQYSDDKKCTFMKNILLQWEKKNKLFVMKFKVITDEHQANVAVFFFFLAQTNGSSECGSSEENSKIQEYFFLRIKSFVAKIVS